MTVMEARIVHIGINRHWRDVYDYASRPENMPAWASGLASGLVQDGEDWVAQGALGSVRVRFAPRNDFGVIDHLVTMESGLQVNNALRVVANGDGAEVAFTLLKQPDMTDAQFDADSKWVLKDLTELKTLLER
jgi:hypothetical protein